MGDLKLNTSHGTRSLDKLLDGRLNIWLLVLAPPSESVGVGLRKTGNELPLFNTDVNGKMRIVKAFFKNWTTVNNGYLGFRNDEERSEMRYVMRIAELREPSNLWTQIALSGYSQEHTSLSVG